MTEDQQNDTQPSDIARREFVALSVTVSLAATIHDALLVRCALKARAEIIYTWNVKLYGQFGREPTKRLRTP